MSEIPVHPHDTKATTHYDQRQKEYECVLEQAIVIRPEQYMEQHKESPADNYNERYHGWNELPLSSDWHVTAFHHLGDISLSGMLHTLLSKRAPNAVQRLAKFHSERQG